MELDKKARPGTALKAIRRSKDLTLAQVAARTEIPISTLGRIERNESSPNYEQLLKLSEGLEVDITQLFSAFQAGPAAGPRERRSLNHLDEGQVLELPHQVLRYLSTDLRNKSFTPVIAEIKARSLAEFGEYQHHPGEEFVYVIEGELELHTEHYMPAVLAAGESIYFDSSMGHAYIARGNRSCRILAISTAPHAHAETHAQVPVQVPSGTTTRRPSGTASDVATGTRMTAQARRTRR
jgi:transcriptional regulator with XRE-family HTH domain